MRDSMRFALWRWQNILGGDDRAVYLRKLYLVRTPLFQVALHWILRPDPGRDLHDHPRSFVSVLLRGGYLEERPVAADVNPARGPAPTQRLTADWRVALSAAYRRAPDAHRIRAVLPGTLSLVLWGRKRREWGFHTPIGWIHWHTYTRSLR